MRVKRDAPVAPRGPETTGQARHFLARWLRGTLNHCGLCAIHVAARRINR